MGRGFTTRDTATAPAVAVVNQSFVKAFFKLGENRSVAVSAHLARNPQVTLR